ncbi:MAG: capsular polysaccharide biosynthesis protein CapF [Porphyromonadaceae bacterium]|jgi:UDP-2-acetamido-2,6-beta-L-arabino-hexul-4-ose reductase|nr:capsular polysaccharide biosynthesis protein CapF [Porphyromonadaceae bacterium]
MKILITGAKGFVGKNLIAELKNQGFTDILECDTDTTSDELDLFVRDCQFVFHLAGVNRPENTEDYMKGNFGFTSELLNLLKKHNNKSPLLLSSSIQAALDNPYGKSKKAGENLIFEYGEKNNTPVFVYRLPNVFGKWCRPNYNSAVATFCHNIAHDLPIQVNDPNVFMKLVYIDDVVLSFIDKLKNGSKNISDKRQFETVNPVHEIKLGEIADLIYSFKESRNSLFLPNFRDEFTKKLYSTYLSYLPKDQFNYFLKMNTDARGSFTEFLKSVDCGQVSINISKPGIVKGQHWHHTKNEKFLVVSGNGVIRFRKIDSDEVIEYFVSGEKLEVLDIPVGYTHNIENLGNSDMVTVMWANEVFDKEKPDTYWQEV